MAIIGLRSIRPLTRRMLEVPPGRRCRKRIDTNDLSRGLQRSKSICDVRCAARWGKLRQTAIAARSCFPLSGLLSLIDAPDSLSSTGDWSRRGTRGPRGAALRMDHDRTQGQAVRKG